MKNRIRLNDGDTVVFGRWPQGSNGEVLPLEWVVLSFFGSSAWMVTKHIIDCSRFSWNNHEFSGISNIRWKNSEIRDWLNGAFLKKAFSPEEQSLLEVQQLNCGVYNNRSTSYAGDNTEDKVALLCCEDVTYKLARLGIEDCTPTAYAVSLGASQEAHVWWLREAGYPDYRAAIVSNGIISQHGANSIRKYGIRPAIRVSFPQYGELTSNL